MKRALFTLLSIAFGAACNCEGSGVTQLDAEIEVVPLELDMGEYPLGVRAQGAFTISSVGEVMLRISDFRLEDNQIFRIINDPIRTMNPSQSDVLLIEARPEELGEHTATLVVASDARTRPLIRIPVRLRAVPVPPCDDGNICTFDSFDTEANDCTHTFADGVPCSPADKCVINAVCSQGVCLGETKVCDDQSMCTRDLCRQTDGECVFIEDATICDDHNPCTADSCTPEGCEHVPLPSGTACDDGDLCTTQDACFAGECIGNGQPDGSPCDDHDSCTINDTCFSGVCTGESIIAPKNEGEVVFEYPLTEWIDRAFLHRREVSLGDDGTFFGMDHLNLPPPNPGLTHVIFAFNQCGTPVYEFAYRPPDSHVWVSFVRREMQLETDNTLRIVVGVRNRLEDGFGLNTTAYVLDDLGRVRQSRIQEQGAETGRSLLPDGSHIYGVIWPLNEEVPPEGDPQQNLIIVRNDVQGNVLWRHERASGWWAEFLGVAGPRVLFWSLGRFGALDFNTGATVWTHETTYVANEMALHTGLNLGVIRADGRLFGVDILNGTEIFSYPREPDVNYVPRTDPVISADGRVLVMMQRRSQDFPEGLGLDWVELTASGDVVRVTPLPYEFPPTFGETRHEDQGDDPYPTVADDGVTYVGYGDQFWAIDRDGTIRWTLTSTVESAFTGTVPLLRDDGILLINEQSRRIIGVKTNGGRMSQTGWASFRHDGRRTKFTP